jgi:hypothetical protein
VVLAVSATLAQHQQKKTVPSSKPADDGPSLEVTMKFIQDKLNGIGPVSYVAKVRDVYTYNDGIGTDTTLSGTEQSKYEVTKVVADPSTCRISFHWKNKAERDGAATESADFPKHEDQEDDDGFPLKLVEHVVVMPLKQSLEEGFKNNMPVNHPSRSYKVDPPVFALSLELRDFAPNDFLFLDEQLANRVAKAMVHAVELCGGGSEPEPF